MDAARIALLPFSAAIILIFVGIFLDEPTMAAIKRWFGVLFSGRHPDE
jgi:hypothetical protein